MYICFVNLNTQKMLVWFIDAPSSSQKFGCCVQKFCKWFNWGGSRLQEKKKNQKEPIVKCVGLSQISAGLLYPASLIYIDAGDFSKSC